MQIVASDDQNITVFERFAHVDYANYDFETCNTAIDPIGPFYPIDVFAAIKVARGNYRLASQLLRRQRDSLIRWIKANPEFSQIAVDEEEGVLDDVETIVKDQALSGDGAQTRFLLSTKGKNRGYSTKVETSGRIGLELEFSRIVETRLTDDQVLQMAEEIVERRASEAKVINGDQENA